MSDRQRRGAGDASESIAQNAATAHTIDASPGSTSSGGALAVGQRLGERYVIRASIGRGAMGEVYRAFDETLGEEVALKVVRSFGATAPRDEVRLAHKVTHPNVCRTYDLETIGGHDIVKMELVRGETLADLLAREGRLPISRAVAIAREIRAGLMAAHARGIVHRDLKPANVMLERDRVVLMDFGLAQLASREADQFSGTPAYMAPEQLAGGELDGRADLYALGCVLFEMLCAERVFSGSLIEVMGHHASSPPPDVRARRPEVPRWLARAVAQLLAKDPTARPAGAERLVSGPSRMPYFIAAAGVLAVGALVLWYLARTPWQPSVRTVSAVDQAGAATLSPDATRIAYAADPDDNGRNQIFIESIDDASRRAITDTDSNFYYPEWQDERHVIAVAGPPAVVYRIDVDTGLREEVARGGRGIPCGPRLLLREDRAPGCSGCSRFVIPDTQEELARFPAGDRVEYFRCDRTGSRIVYTLGRVGAPTSIWLLERGSPPRRLATGGLDAQSPTFTHDGTAILYSSRHDQTHIWELSLERGNPRVVTSGAGPDYWPDVSRDGRALLYSVARSAGVVFSYRPGLAKPRRLTADGNLAVHGVTSDGRVLVVREGVDVALVEPGGIRVLTRGDVAALAHDDRDVIVARDSDLIATPLAGGPTRLITALPPPARVVRIHPAADGTLHLAIAKGDDLEAWRVPLAGGPAVRAVAGYDIVMPAPVGGWQAALDTVSRPRRLHLFAPGTAPGDRPTKEIEHVSDAVWAPDGSELVYWDNREVRRYRIATRETQQFVERAHVFGLALARDGTLVLGEPVVRVQHELVTNFDER